MTAPTEAKPILKEQQQKPKRRNRIVWDEENLEENAAYHAANPVTMKIDEPKTPFEHDDGVYPDDEEDEEERDNHQIAEEETRKNTSTNTGTDAGVDNDDDGTTTGSGWHDTEYNKIAARARLTQPVAVVVSTAADPTASSDTVSASPLLQKKKARAGFSLPAVSTEPLTEEALAEKEAERKKAEFKHMRKAVYADEGAKFRALLAQKVDDDDDEEEEEDE